MTSLFHFDSQVPNEGSKGSSAYNFHVANLLISFNGGTQALLSLAIEGTVRKVFAKKTPEGWGRMELTPSIKYGGVKKMVYQPGVGKILLLEIKPEVKRSEEFLDMNTDERIEAGYYSIQELSTLEEIISALEAVKVSDVTRH